MLYAQLEAAIGKVVTAEDFRLFMQHHERKLFAPAVRPKPFSYAIRRPDHYPDGVLSIEAAASTAAGLAEPIFTTVRAIPGPSAPMSFAINAATSVSFTGDRYLHAYIAQTFAGSRPPSLQLSARARQFSSFLMVIGRIGSATTFEPQYGIILQNKDDLTIPLMLETLPSAKEFKDAIESLSPEQQRFAKAYREMQLEGSVFGVLIIQLKPQLEALLKLPADSLTKEIQLCQDLLELFITYQIPSDLLTYDGDPAAAPAQKVKAVEAHVAAIHKMLGKMKEQEVADAVQHHAFAHPQAMFDTLSSPDFSEAIRMCMPPMECAPSAPMPPSAPMRRSAANCAAPMAMERGERGSVSKSAAPPAAAPPPQAQRQQLRDTSLQPQPQPQQAQVRPER
jgi:hypothetical protein